MFILKHGKATADKRQRQKFWVIYLYKCPFMNECTAKTQMITKYLLHFKHLILYVEPATELKTCKAMCESESSGYGSPKFWSMLVYMDFS